MRNVRGRKVLTIVGLTLVVLAGSVAGGYLFQATVGGPHVQAQEAQPVMKEAPPSFASLINSVQQSVVAIGTKKVPAAAMLQGQGTPFEMPGPGLQFGNPDIQKWLEQFLGQQGEEGQGGPQRFEFRNNGDSDIWMQTPKGTRHLFKDDEGQWWIETPGGEKKKWDGPDPLEQFGGGDAQATEEEPLDLVHTIGSGVVISPTGYVVTNAHVAKALPEDDIWVQFWDDGTLPAKLVGLDEETDVAVLKVEPADALTFSPLGDSDAAQIGDWVVASGQPFGLQHTFTAGILSARGRTLGGTYDRYLQTDAMIHPGNSGGPLYNMNGEIVGINTAIATSNPLQPAGEGIGFAIPSNVVDRIAKQIMESGKVVRGYIGANLWSGQVEVQKRGHDYGAAIGAVTKGGPAEKAGLQAGDVVISFNGQRIEKSEDLINLCAATAPGTQVELEYVRAGKTEKVTVTIGERPSRADIQKEIGGE